MDSIANAIRASRYTAAEVARRLGLSQPAMSDRMRGRTRWTLADARHLALLLGVTLDELVGDEDLELGIALTEAAS